LRKEKIDQLNKGTMNRYAEEMS